jgi:hypothetical protein
MSALFMTPKGRTAHIVQSGKKTLCGLTTKSGKTLPVGDLFDKNLPECDECFNKFAMVVR